MRKTPKEGYVQPLPHPLDLPKAERIVALRGMTSGQRLAIGVKLSDDYRRWWLEALRREFPAMPSESFRRLVIARLLKEGNEERQIARAIGRETLRVRPRPSSER